jgi:hypothetical protein
MAAVVTGVFTVIAATVILLPSPRSSPPAPPPVRTPSWRDNPVALPPIAPTGMAAGATNTPVGSRSAHAGQSGARSGAQPNLGPKTPPRVVARFDRPTAGQTVPQCVEIAGTVPAVTGDEAYWLGHQSQRSPTVYLSRRLNVDPVTQRWGLGRIIIGRDDQTGQTFDLMLIRTEGELSQDFADRIDSGERSFTLPGGARVLHQVRVTRGAAMPCDS